MDSTLYSSDTRKEPPPLLWRPATPCSYVPRESILEELPSSSSLSCLSHLEVSLSCIDCEIEFVLQNQFPWPVVSLKIKDEHLRVNQSDSSECVLSSIPLSSSMHTCHLLLRLLLAPIHHHRWRQLMNQTALQLRCKRASVMNAAKDAKWSPDTRLRNHLDYVPARTHSRWSQIFIAVKLLFSSLVAASDFCFFGFNEDLKLLCNENW